MKICEGSPPPMRGKAPQGLPHGADFRITPAYAGKSLTAVLLIHGGRDHPRLCGEKACMCAIGGVTAGSPPPMRGKAEGGAGSGCCRRITPAYAGKRHLTIQLVCTPPGSPPPMRGKVRRTSPAFLTAGITPAYAGKSFFSMHRHYKCQDHPRLCGEKAFSSEYTPS